MKDLAWNITSDMQIIDRITELEDVLSVFPKDKLEYVQKFASTGYNIPDIDSEMRYIVCILHAIEELNSKL